MFKRGLLAALALASVTASSAQANLLTNGGLEKSSGSAVNQYNLIYVPTGGNQLPGWTITSGTVDLVPGASSGNMYWQNIEGAFSLDLCGTPGIGAIQQSVTTIATDTYTLTFDFAINPEDGPLHESGTTKIMRITALGADGSTVLATQDYSGTKGTRTLANMQYLQQTFTFTADGSVATLRLAALTPLNLPVGATSSTIFCGPVIDNLDLEVGGGAVVPEPASLGLLGAGAAGLLLRRRRKS